MSDIKWTIKQRKWRWLGHTLRIGQNDITNQSLKWNPQGNRIRYRWVDQMNFKRRSTKLSVKLQQLLLPNKNEKAMCVASALLRDK